MPAYTQWVMEGGAYFRFAYDAEVVFLLKSIPYQGRKWDPDQRMWWVASEYQEYAIYVLRDGIREYDDWYPDQKKNGSQERSSQDFRGYCPYDTFGELLKVGTDAMAKAVFREMVKHLHPDVGGDTKLMQRLNFAFDAIKEMRGMK